MNKIFTRLVNTAFLSVFMLGFNLKPSQAQTSSVDPIEALTQAGDCDRNAEVTYQSETLASRERQTSIFFEIVLHRIATNPDPNYCLQYSNVSIQTPVVKMIVERFGNREVIEIGLENNDFAVIPRPVSFSPDGNYLALEYQFGHYESGQAVAIVDLRTNQLLTNDSNATWQYCHYSYDEWSSIADFMSFEGFTNALSEGTNFLVGCQGIYSCLEEDCDLRFELVNLDRGTTQRVMQNTIDVQNYGQFISPASITKYQLFPDTTF
jgi:hypothetical protein